jgi:hypothetical protein
MFHQEWCLKVIVYDQDKYSNATELCDVNLALKDVKNLTTAKEALTISCNLTRTNRVSCTVRIYYPMLQNINTRCEVNLLSIHFALQMETTIYPL